MTGCFVTVLSLLPKEGGGAVRRRRIEASGLCQFFRAYPQVSAQLLPGEGAYVTFYTVEALEWGSMVPGDFSTSLRFARNDRGERFEI